MIGRINLLRHDLAAVMSLSNSPSRSLRSRPAGRESEPQFAQGILRQRQAPLFLRNLEEIVKRSQLTLQCRHLDGLEPPVTIGGKILGADVGKGLATDRMSEEGGEDDLFDIISALLHAHGVAVALDEFARGHTLEDFGIAGKIGPVGPDLPVSRPSLGILSDVEGSRD